MTVTAPNDQRALVIRTWLLTYEGPVNSKGLPKLGQLNKRAKLDPPITKAERNELWPWRGTL